MAITVIENLRGFYQSKPPIVIFMICLGGFAVALITFAYVVRVKDLPNPNVAEDWNTFMQSISDVEFCVMSNSSDHVTESSSPSVNTVPIKKINGLLSGIPMTTAVTSPEEDSIVNVSFSMFVEMTPTVDFVSIPHNVTYLSTTLTGHQLGLQGHVAEQDMNVTFTLPFEWNTTKCTGGDCNAVNILACISFQAPESFFPRTSHPNQCLSSIEGGVEYHVKMVGSMKTEPKAVWCRSRPIIQVQYELNPSLSIMSMHDRSVINLHLMHTSYFLFVMVITMFCYALVRGRPSKGKIVHYIEKVPTHA